MSIFDFFKKEEKNAVSSAQVAKDRLSVIVASDNRLRSRLTTHKIEQMKREILDIVNNYVSGVDITDVNIEHKSQDDIDVLEMNINLPDSLIQK